MVDITKPTIMGYEITPWFIVMCLCFVGIILFAILVFSGFANKELREQKMIERAVRNTTNRNYMYTQEMEDEYDGDIDETCVLDAETEVLGTDETAAMYTDALDVKNNNS